MNKISKPEGIYHLNRNAFIFGGEPLIFHCHHYNLFLQMSIEETKKYIDVYPILIDSAQEVAYTHFKNLFLSCNLPTVERKEFVELHFKTAGFGLINLSEISKNGGSVSSPSEHYSYGWKTKWDLRREDEPGVSFFTRGFLAGATEAIYDLPLGILETDQTKCLAKGDDTCEFYISN